MGYYTRYELEIEDDEDFKILTELRESNECAEDALIEDGGTNESCKWYEHEEDLKTFSKKYPDKLFTLSGKGEEPEDIWTLYVKDGKTQRCKAKITIDTFDPKKLA